MKHHNDVKWHQKLLISTLSQWQTHIVTTLYKI